MLWFFTVLVALVMFAGAFGGNIAPSSLKGICLAVLAFPYTMLVFLLVVVLDALWCRKALILCAIVLVGCGSAMWDVCPLNIFSPSASKYKDKPRFSLMTYNVASMKDLTLKYPGGVNPTVSYILNVNADIVNLQECYPIGVYKQWHITPAQVDSLHKVYPYIITSGSTLTLLSKFPAEALHIPRDTDRIAAFRINIDGTPVTLFNVHLQSYGLNADDKELFHKMTDLDDPDEGLRDVVKDVKKELLAKVQYAAVRRQKQTERLVKLIDRFGGPNVIVAGDFNDAPGCYALRRLEDCKMKEVYPALAFGPTISFHADRFYFRIDHVLWRGGMKPLRMWRGNLLSSDHYPFTTVFTLTE